MYIKTFYDEVTCTFTYIVVDTKTNKCAVIDSVLNYDQYSGRVTTQSADYVINYIRDNNLTNKWILETHIHADHITASFYLKNHIGGKQAMGIKIKDVLNLWVPKLDTSKDTPISGEQFDVLFEEGDVFKIGSLDVKVWLTPGHTPACASYLIEDAIFVGDTMFAPEIGTARVDFPGGSAKDMYTTIKRFYTLPDETRMYLCHDYPQEGTQAKSVITVAQAKNNNVMIRTNTTLNEYVQKREFRDKSLPIPKLLYPSIQANLRLGNFGVKSSNGIQYIKIPVRYIK